MISLDPSTPLTISAGKPYPFGATQETEGTNFAIVAKDVQKISLCLFGENHQTPVQEIELHPEFHKTGSVWHAYIQGLPPFIALCFSSDT